MASGSITVYYRNTGEIVRMPRDVYNEFYKPGGLLSGTVNRVYYRKTNAQKRRAARRK